MGPAAAVAPPPSRHPELYRRVVVGGLGGDAIRDGLALARRLAAVGSEPQVGADARLAEVAEATHADLVVIARGGHGTVHPWPRLGPFGRLLHRTPCSIAIAPRGYADAARPLTRLALAFDGRPASAVALAHAQRLMAELCGSLTPVTVVAPASFVAAWAWAATAGIAPVAPPTLAAALAAAGAPPATVLCGSPGAELVRFALTRDLMVCGSRRPTPAHPGFGGVSGHLARYAGVPLLIARSGP